MKYREIYPDLRPQEISYTPDGIAIRLQVHYCGNPRLEFLKALKEFDGEEINAFDTMPNGTRIQKDTKLGENVKYGSNCVIGGYGFGYEKDTDGSLIRMPHLSHVEIQDEVTIHNNVNIDRGVLSPTIIGKGTIIDSLVHCAHGVVIGEGCCIVAQAGIGGSCVIGPNTYIGFGAHIKNKVKIGSNVIVGMGAVVLEDVPDNWVVVGNPAKFLRKND